MDSLPGGRVGTAVATLGISELVLWFLSETANFGKKTALRWDDLVNGRTLQRGDRIIASVENARTTPGAVEIVLKTDISAKKEIAFQISDQGAFRNDQRVGNYYSSDTVTLNDANGRPQFYVDSMSVPVALLRTSLLEFSSQEGGLMSGRYVPGDLATIATDRARLTFYWKDQ